MRFRQIRADTWAWSVGQTICEVRIFGTQGTLIWSNHVKTTQGPQFGAGVRQTFAQFMADGSPEGYTPPDELVASLRDAIVALETPPYKRGLFGRLFGNK